MRDTILTKILDKYSRVGKHTPAGAKDIRLLCNTLRSVLYVADAATLFMPNHADASETANKLTFHMNELERNFLKENKS